MNELNPGQGAIELVSATVQTGQAAEFEGATVEENLSYWRQRLAGIPAILELPVDRPRPPAQSFRAARVYVLLHQDLKQALQSLSYREGVPLFTVLLAAFQALLARYTRQDDIVVGAPPGDADGTTVAIRTDAGGDPTFRQLLSRVSDAANDAREHEDVPWERLVEAVQPDRDPSHHPIFQVLFSLDESQLLLDSGWGIGEKDSADVRSHVDLQLQLASRQDGLAALFTYSTDLFDATTVVRMTGHFQRLLEGVVTNPDECISRIPLLTDAERRQLVVDWNDTRTEYPKDLCAHQLFEAQAARTPDAIAAVCGNNSLTYKELDWRANQLARHLIKLGTKPDGLVGICLERSLDMMVGLLGILKAGSAYVPLDPAYPRDRIAYMVENSEAPLLLTQAQLKDILPGTKSKVVLIDSDWPEIAEQSQESPGLTLDPENRAYVIYTSGSTGKPKGVEIPHRALVNFLTTMAHRPGMDPRDRWLCITTLSFDMAVPEFHLPLAVGASLEIVSREVASDGDQLLAKLKGSGATILQATPATWRMLLDAGWNGTSGLKILVGAEAVPLQLVNQLLERADSVWHMYGPTETTVWSTRRKLEPGQKSVPIGRPVANTEIFILDKVLQSVPIGVAGELYIGGDGVARGYLKQPELTAEKFIRHPFSSDPKARLYKTGDLARYLPNGDIEFLGRIDHQVKIRGFRIELGEIEAVLRQHPEIKDTVVMAREDVPGEKRVVAYIVPTLDAEPTTANLRAFLKEKLPEYMLPSLFVLLEGMPLNPNGKVDRRALPAPDQAKLAPHGRFAAPRDKVEIELAQIWESLLGVRPIGIHDNYFDLGGHSLVAVRLMHRIEGAFGKNLPIATLLQAPTIEQLAAILRDRASSPAWSCLVPIQTRGYKSPFFCFHGANGAVVRFHALGQQLGPDRPFYGVQANGLGEGQVCHQTTEDMAAHYLKEILAVQPQGPQFLGGYSFGGDIAFEVAQQLVAQGYEAPTVVLFDTHFPQEAADSSAQPSAASAFLNLFRVPASKRWPYFSRMATAPIRMVHRKVHVARLPRVVKKVRKACLQAEHDYRPKPYAGRLIMVRSSHKPLGQTTDPRSGWERCALQGLEILEVPSNHENILLEPQVRSVAEQLKACLDKPRAQESPSRLEKVS